MEEIKISRGDTFETEKGTLLVVDYDDEFITFDLEGTPLVLNWVEARSLIRGDELYADFGEENV